MTRPGIAAWWRAFLLGHLANRGRKGIPLCRSRVIVRLALFSLIGLGLSPLRAETIPPVPKNHFNDYAGVINPAAAQTLNRELEQFERDTSNQLVVAIFPRMDSESSVADYTVRVAQSWHVGEKGRSNGAVLFVFVQSRQLYIQVGYGLEPVLTDALCSQIIRNEIAPRFRAGDYTGGLRAGVHAMIAATRHEYQGTGRTVHDVRIGGNGSTHHRPVQSHGPSLGLGVVPMVFFVILILVISAIRARFRRGWGNPYSRRTTYDSGWSSGSTGSFFSGGSSSSDSGSFSSGGGDFGGGGSGGSW